MKKSILLASIFTAVFLTGCTSIILKMAAFNYPSSKYNPIPLLESDMNDYYSLLEKSSRDGAIVEDELGSYYIKKEKNDMYSRFSLLNQDAGILKTTLSSSIGFMEPIYSYQKNLQLELDWKETKRQYKFFTKVIGLNLLPLKTTRRYHDLINKWAVNKATERAHYQPTKTPLANNLALIGDGMKITSSAVKGESGLYTPEYYNGLLSKIINNATYLISFRSVNIYAKSEYSNQMLQQGTGTNPQASANYSSNQGGALAYNQLTTSIDGFDFLAINFIPVSYFKNLNSGGEYRLYSGCQVSSKSASLKQIKALKEMTNIPYYSGISTVVKDKYSNAKTAKNKFYSALKQEKKNRLLVENACKVGFKAMGLSGIIESKKLR